MVVAQSVALQARLQEYMEKHVLQLFPADYQLFIV